MYKENEGRKGGEEEREIKTDAVVKYKYSHRTTLLLLSLSSLSMSHILYFLPFNPYTNKQIVIIFMFFILKMRKFTPIVIHPARGRVRSYHTAV